MFVTISNSSLNFPIDRTHKWDSVVDSIQGRISYKHSIKRYIPSNVLSLKSGKHIESFEIVSSRLVIRWMKEGFWKTSLGLNLHSFKIRYAHVVILTGSVPTNICVGYTHKDNHLIFEPCKFFQQKYKKKCLRIKQWIHIFQEHL